MKLTDKNDLENALGLDISDVIMAKLEEAFPDRIPMKPGISPQDIGRYQGQQTVIQYLRALKKDLQEGDTS